MGGQPCPDEGEAEEGEERQEGQGERRGSRYIRTWKPDRRTGVQRECAMKHKDRRQATVQSSANLEKLTCNNTRFGANQSIRHKHNYRSGIQIGNARGSTRDRLQVVSAWGRAGPHLIRRISAESVPDTAGNTKFPAVQYKGLTPSTSCSVPKPTAFQARWYLRIEHIRPNSQANLYA